VLERCFISVRGAHGRKTSEIMVNESLFKEKDIYCIRESRNRVDQPETTRRKEYTKKVNCVFRIDNLSFLVYCYVCGSHQQMKYSKW